MFRISIACSELASTFRRVAFVAPEGIPAEPRAPDRRGREMESANDRFGSRAVILAASKSSRLRLRQEPSARPATLVEMGHERNVAAQLDENLMLA